MSEIIVSKLKVGSGSGDSRLFCVRAGSGVDLTTLTSACRVSQTGAWRIIME